MSTKGQSALGLGSSKILRPLIYPLCFCKMNVATKTPSKLEVRLFYAFNWLSNIQLLIGKFALCTGLGAKKLYEFGFVHLKVTKKTNITKINHSFLATPFLTCMNESFVIIVCFRDCMIKSKLTIVNLKIKVVW